MELLRVNTTSPYYAEAEDLMKDAFPPEERRPLAEQRDYADHNPLFRPHVVLDNGKFAGLLNFWQLDGFLYAEHLATLPALRGGGLGKRIMEQFIQLAGQLPIVLEVEPPTDDLKRRRIGFYQRCGFTLWERTYTQPPYSPALPAIPLRLMVHGQLDETRDFTHICHEIYHHVYGCTPAMAGQLLNDTSWNL